jgi:hypothetical protein
LTNDNGFGDFEAFPEASHADSINAVAIENDPVILKDDRGGFNDFGNSNTFEGAPDNNAANAGIDNPLALADLIDDDDGFGDLVLSKRSRRPPPQRDVCRRAHPPTNMKRPLLQGVNTLMLRSRMMTT